MDRTQRVLVTGGRGFIAVNLVELLREDWDVRVLDNMEHPSPTGWSDGQCEFIEGDILDEALLRAAMQDVTAVVHLAAYGSVVDSVMNPVMNFRINAEGTFRVLNAAVAARVKRFVFASTGGALIGDAEPPVDEGSLPKPISPYGAGKLCGEAYCHAFAKSYGLETVCLRFGNVYGPHSLHKKGVVTNFAKALLRDEPMIVYGDGAASRDYIYVKDLANGIVAALRSDIEGGEVFHLATSRETTVWELGEMLRKIAGRPQHPIEFRATRRGEVVRNFANYEKARLQIGFRPEFRLEEGLEATWKWFEEQPASLLRTDVTDA